MKRLHTKLLLGAITALMMLSIFTNYASAYTPTGSWPISVGDRAFYKQTTNEATSPSPTYTYFEITSIADGTFTTGMGTKYFNLLNGTCYIYNNITQQWVVATQVGQPGLTMISGVNDTTNEWLGALFVLNRFPAPAPYGWDIQDIFNNITASIGALGWIGPTTSLVGRTTIIDNGTLSIEITYGTDNICTLMRYNSSSDTVYWINEYTGSIPPNFSQIPGYELGIILSIIFVTVIMVRKKINAK
jgi:hypothetical protein